MQEIHKQLAVHADLAIGHGTVTQERGGVISDEQQLELAFIFRTVVEIRAIDSTKYTRVQLHQTGATDEYWLDSTSMAVDDGSAVLKPDAVNVLNPGRWIIIVQATPSSHSGLSGVTANQHHPQLHDMDTHSDLVGTPAAGDQLVFDGSDWLSIPTANHFQLKPISLPILLVMTGQSNAFSAAIGTAINTSNPSVFSWESDGAVGGQARPFGWKVVDLEATVQLDYAGGGSLHTGIPAGDVGHMGWACADYIQRVTNRDVYILCVAHSGQAISEWLGAQPIKAELQSRLTTLLATSEMTTPGISVADGIIWMQGESDASRTPADYITDWNSVRDWMETDGWAVRRTTQWMIGETGNNFLAYKTMARTLMALDRSEDEYVRLIRTVSLAFQSALLLHFDGDSHIELGQAMAKSLLAGPIPKTSGPLIRYIEVTANYETTGEYDHEVAVCTNTGAITITLQLLLPGDKVTVIRANTGAVTIDGDAANISGAATRVLAAQRDSAYMIATTLEWVTIN